jgi:hypothetical protein
MPTIFFPLTVAVGIPVTRHPPHRSRRAALPHRAPASGLTCWHPQRPAVRGRARVPGMPRPWVRSLVCAAAFPLARALPSTSSASSLGQPLFEGFLGTLERSDALHPCITVVSRGFTVRTWHHCQARCRASRVPHTVFSRMPEVCAPAGCGDALPSRRPRCGLPRVRSASAPRSRPMSGLHTLPARSPGNASRLSLPIATHDSGPVWVANPSLSGTFTLQHSAGLSRRGPERQA